jgi:hypothetical protein
MRFVIGRIGWTFVINEQNYAKSSCEICVDFEESPWKEAKVRSFDSGIWFIHPRLPYQGFGFFSSESDARLISNRMKLHGCQLEVREADRRLLDYFSPSWTAVDLMAEAFWQSDLVDDYQDAFERSEEKRRELLNSQKPLFSTVRVRVDPEPHPYLE